MNWLACLQGNCTERWHKEGQQREETKKINASRCRRCVCVVFNVGMDASMNLSVKPSAATDDSSATVPNNAKRKRARDSEL